MNILIPLTPEVRAELERQWCASYTPEPGDRARLEAAIESAIALLDALDGDPDLEPSLCGRGVGAPTAAGDDREREDEHDEDGGDDEPEDDGVGDADGLLEQVGSLDPRLVDGDGGAFVGGSGL